MGAWTWGQAYANLCLWPLCVCVCVYVCVCVGARSNMWQQYTTTNKMAPGSHVHDIIQNVDES